MPEVRKNQTKWRHTNCESKKLFVVKLISRAWFLISLTVPAFREEIIFYKQPQKGKNE